MRTNIFAYPIFRNVTIAKVNISAVQNGYCDATLTIIPKQKDSLVTQNPLSILTYPYIPAMDMLTPQVINEILTHMYYGFFHDPRSEPYRSDFYKSCDIGDTRISFDYDRAMRIEFNFTTPQLSMHWGYPDQLRIDGLPIRQWYDVDHPHQNIQYSIRRA